MLAASVRVDQCWLQVRQDRHQHVYRLVSRQAGQNAQYVTDTSRVQHRQYHLGRQQSLKITDRHMSTVTSGV